MLTEDELKELSRRPGTPPRWPVKERVLTAIVAAYAFLVVLYLPFQWVVLKYVLLVVSPGLVFLVPELATKHRLLLRLALTCVAIAGLALVQVVSDRSNQRDTAAIRHELGGIRLAISLQDEFRAQEARFIEKVIVNPAELVDGVKGADIGLLQKSGRLKLRVARLESDLLRAEPALASRILSISGDADSEVAAYEALSAAPLRPDTARQVKQILDRRREVVAYQRLAGLIKAWRWRYEAILATAKGGKIDESRRDLAALAADLAVLTEFRTIGGYYSHLGTLALGYGSREQVLRWLYQGLEMDGEHVPLYESIGYALWAKNEDTRTATLYARQGLTMTAQLASAVEADFLAFVANIDKIRKSAPRALRPMIDALAEQVSRHQPELREGTRRHATNFAARFKHQIAYFSAVALTNEKEARAFALELYNSNPNDLSYVEILGFVRARFSKTVDELDSALELLKRCASDPADLCTIHYNWAYAKLDRLKRG